MAGPHVLSAYHAQSTFAGNTRAGLESPTAQPASVSEIVGRTPLLGEMDTMLAGGFHPEMLLAQGTSEVRNVEARIGPHGGTVTNPGGGAATGPAASAKRLFEAVRRGA